MPFEFLNGTNLDISYNSKPLISDNYDPKTILIALWERKHHPNCPNWNQPVFQAYGPVFCSDHASSVLGIDPADHVAQWRLFRSAEQPALPWHWGRALQHSTWQLYGIMFKPGTRAVSVRSFYGPTVETDFSTHKRESVPTLGYICS